MFPKLTRLWDVLRGETKDAADETAGSAGSDDRLRRMTIISGDMSRNHVARACSLADALSPRMQVDLLAFRFPGDDGQDLFDEIPFKKRSFRGCDFPEFFTEVAGALNFVRGHFLYVLEPELPSLGLAFMANYHRGAPIILEIEGGSAAPMAKGIDNGPRNPRSQHWSKVLRPLVADLPVVLDLKLNADDRSRAQAAIGAMAADAKRHSGKRRTYDVSQQFAQNLASFHASVARA